MSRTKSARNKSKTVSAKTKEKPIIKQSKISKLSTSEISAVLAKRGFLIIEEGKYRKQIEKAALKPYPVPEERCVEAEYVEPKNTAKDMSSLQSIFHHTKESVEFLRDSVIVLEKSASKLFGYPCDCAEPKMEEMNNAEHGFKLLDEVRSQLISRLAKVTNALSDFIG